MGGNFEEHITKIERAAVEVGKGDRHPLELGAAITSIFQENGEPAFFLIPTAEPLKVRMPGTPLTMIDPEGNFIRPELYVPGKRDGMRFTTCAMTDPRTAMLATSDPNVPGQRMHLGGAGVTKANRSQLERGAGMWMYPDLNGPAVVGMNRVIFDFAVSNPDKVIGYTNVVRNNGAMNPMPASRRVPGHYFSEEPLESIAHYPITWRMLQAVGDIQLMNF